jgi:arylsulfatase A-like enzyme
MLPLLTHQSISRQQIQPVNKALLQLSYYNAVANADWLVGQLQQLLDSFQLMTHSTMLVTSDHGESLFDDGFLGHGHQLNDTQTKVLLVSNRQINYPPVLGHADVAPLLLATALGAPVPQSPAAVLQVVGLVRAPQQIARIDAQGRMLYDFRQRHFRAGDKASWADFAELSAADQQRALQLIQSWGLLRYQQSDLYQQQLRGH